MPSRLGLIWEAFSAFRQTDRTNQKPFLVSKCFPESHVGTSRSNQPKKHTIIKLVSNHTHILD